MTRTEHLSWAKTRALAYLEQGQFYSPVNAIQSFTSDLSKHEETAVLIDTKAAKAGIEAMLGTVGDIRRFIESFS